jgi:hypothetical protein
MTAPQKVGKVLVSMGLMLFLVGFTLFGPGRAREMVLLFGFLSLCLAFADDSP